MNGIAALLVLVGQPTEAAAIPVSCELHLWGARKSFPENSRFAAPFALRGTFHADRSQPLANINIADPVLRLSRVPDSVFDGYFGAGVHINVIRHPELLHPKVAGKAKVPLSPRKAACNGDLILTDLVDIEGPSRDPGFLAAAIMAPAGMNMQITYRRFGADDHLTYAKRDGVNGKLAIPRSQWGNDQVKSVEAIDASVADGIRAFATEHLAVLDLGS